MHLVFHRWREMRLVGLHSDPADYSIDLYRSIFVSDFFGLAVHGNSTIFYFKKKKLMNQHLHIITLGVRDFEKSKKFYSETLGWKIARPQENIAFFQAGGVVLAIYQRDLPKTIDSFSLVKLKPNSL